MKFLARNFLNFFLATTIMEYENVDKPCTIIRRRYLQKFSQ
jgi:hypothetical protein